MLTGPKGIGKATLAFRFARYVLSQGIAAPDVPAGGGGGLFSEEAAFGPDPGGMYLDPGHPVFQRVASGGHADLKTVERSSNDAGKLRSEIVVDDVRAIAKFLSLTPAEGGWRIVVIDSAEEMNRIAANAVLKVLEEPPGKSLLLLTSHNPGRLLPTIRSRCSLLAMKPLGQPEILDLLRAAHPEMTDADARALAHLSDGSIGRALELQEEGGIELYADLMVLLERLDDPDIVAVHAIAGKLGRSGADQAFATFADLLRGWMARFLVAASLGDAAETGPERDLAMRLNARAGLDRWLEVWEKINRLIERTDAVNLDRRQVIIDIFMALSATALQPSPGRRNA